ncbi:MAG: ASCH domain-containing protein [Trueperella sp.]|nr:ASCH domain-containing protein [Trueperella sp.]
MTNGGELPVEPNEGDLDSFWVRAMTRAKLNPIEAVGGQTDLVSLRPGSFAFGYTREQANDLAALVLAEMKTATSSYAAAYDVEGEALPTPEDLWIMCDGEGRPRALLRNTRIQCIPFSEVDDEVAQAEGEGDLEKWRADHYAFFTAEAEELGYDFGIDGDVVVEYFEVLFSH